MDMTALTAFLVFVTAGLLVIPLDDWLERRRDRDRDRRRDQAHREGGR